MTGHDLAMASWAAYWRRAFRAGYAYAEVSEKLKDGPFPLWRREARRNRVHALALIGAALGGLGLALALESAWPAALALAFFAALSLRSACKNGWKAPHDIPTMLLYGVHSHLQQIPIFAGQMASRWDGWRRRRRALIEYK